MNSSPVPYNESTETIELVQVEWNPVDVISGLVPFAGDDLR